MRDTPYYNQVRLILRVLPEIAEEKRFALKGGTAINLFVRNMPRMSIDIDLTWLPLQSREETLENISVTLRNIAGSIQRKVHDSAVVEKRGQSSSQIVKLTVRTAESMIKIEPNLVLRGTVFPCVERDLCNDAEELFELTTTANTLSTADLYGGKLCAALDRQHPRDLFDIKVLMENEGITEDIRTAFVVYLAGHDRPMSELLDPGRVNIRPAYDREFSGMTASRVTYEELVIVRERMIHTINKILTEGERRFLLSIKQGQPQWELLEISGIAQLPALQWKLINIQKMSKVKHAGATEKLREILGL
jgi:predicted nucleotidyltransferase component of viral defense system